MEALAGVCLTRRIVDPTDPPVALAYVRDQVLRVTNGTVEDTHLAQLIAIATEAAEDATQRALMPQTWELILDGFPCGAEPIEVPRPPFIEALSLAYVDPDGVTQTSGSPFGYHVTPSGRTGKARIAPLYGEVWPAIRPQSGAVTLTFRAGYALDETVSPPAVTVPSLICAGIVLVVAELYKNRSLSLTSLVNNAESVLKLDRFWKRVW